MQQTYWIGRSAQFELGHVSCHFYFEYDNNYNLAKLNEAFVAVVEQNDILRAVVLSTGKLKVLEKVKKYVIEEEDLTSFDLKDVEEHLLQKRQKLAHSGFNPEKWPMFDIKASKLSPGNYRYLSSHFLHTDSIFRLHINVDHILMDIKNTLKMFQQWNNIYHKLLKSEPIPPPLTLLTYRDYTMACQKVEQMKVFKKSQEYWMNRISSLPGAPQLPVIADFGKLKKQTFTR